MKVFKINVIKILINRFFPCLLFVIPLMLSGQKQLNSEDLRLIYGDYTRNLVSNDSSDFSSCCCLYGQVRPGESDFMEGPSGIILYGFLWSDGLADYLNNHGKEYKHEDFYDVSSIEQLSLLEIFRVGSTNFNKWNNQKFSFYNPKFVIWIKENLIPDPKLLIGDKKAESWYSYFRRFFRLMTESYIFISKKTDYQKETNDYIHQVNTDENFDALRYLSFRYSDKIKGYEVPKSCEVANPFKDYMAIGFWLRRKADSTNDEFYETLSYVMNLYDKEWFEEVNER